MIHTAIAQKRMATVRCCVGIISNRWCLLENLNLKAKTNCAFKFNEFNLELIHNQNQFNLTSSGRQKLIPQNDSNDSSDLKGSNKPLSFWQNVGNRPSDSYSYPTIVGFQTVKFRLKFSSGLQVCPPSELSSTIWSSLTGWLKQFF